MKYYLESIENVYKEFNSKREGLSVGEVTERLIKYGKNKLAEEKSKPLILRFFEQMLDPMIIVLIAAALISAILSIIANESLADVIIILLVVVLNAVLGVYQESKAEKAIKALQEMSSATTKVLRDNKVMVVKSEDLVVGDIILLEAGDSVPADARIIESASLKIEEAALTGESVPVLKFIDIINLKQGESEIPLGDRANMLYMGSTVVYGRGVAIVVETGMNTEMGKIASAIAKAKEGDTPLQIKLNQLSKVLTYIVLFICLIIFVIQILRAGNINHFILIDSFMIAVSLAVAAIPEGLAAVVTVVLSIGVTNMSKKNAIIRKLTAVETLGCTQVICSDKTGTLTQNKMTVVENYAEDEKFLAMGMALCSDAEIDIDNNVTGEPTEAALVVWANKLGLNKNKLKIVNERINEVPFDSARKMMTTINKKDSEFIQYTKGAPDVVLDKCKYYLKDGREEVLNDTVKNEILLKNKEFADKALRVLALAKRSWQNLPTQNDDSYLEKDMCFVGLVGMIDPVREEVKSAIEECNKAGINVVMITGDHKDTAVAIAKELKILSEGALAISGSELDKMSDEEFNNKYKNIRVYARVQPEHKSKIVEAWKKDGYVTAMTGDGVNDAPSIKIADIGVGMGITGTDVTKNVSDMVLSDDNFATIVSAVEEGRRIYDNIRKSIQFLIASNMSEVISILVATLIGFTILEPVHLLWINLVTDTFPAVALGMEKAERNIMKKKPRNSTDGLFANGMGIDILYQGIMVSILVILSYFIGLFLETNSFKIANSSHGTTMAFLTMSMAEIFHSFNMRSQRQSIFKLNTHNRSLYIAGIASFVATTFVCEIPFIANAFNFTTVSFYEYIIAIVLGSLVIPIVELVKFLQKK